MENIKPNGSAPPMIEVDAAGRIYPVTPDGSQWEIRIHLRGKPDGKNEEIIGEVVYRSYNGGISPFESMITESAKSAKSLIRMTLQQAEEYRKQMFEQQQRAMMAQAPANLKGQ